MKMYLGAKWVDSPDSTPVVSPFNGETVDTVPRATPAQIESALASADRGAEAMRRLGGYERAQILGRLADLVAENVEDLAKTISLEEGKPLSESRAEAGRMPDLIRLCAFEGAQQRGETLPLDAHNGAKGKLGMTLIEPCGVVVAITPFNYPLLLVVHKVAPALAAGNAVILKPANQTPLVALKLTRLILEAGLPEEGIQCVTGLGSDVGTALCADSRVRKISFTGSTAVGEAITRVAGIKRLSLELGSNSPLAVLDDADVESAAKLTAVAGYINAGQVCISAQRVLVDRGVYGDFLDALKPEVERIPVGDPFTEGVRLSAMVSEGEARRVGQWIDEAVDGGARIVTGGTRQRSVYAPTVIADVKPSMRISRDELFGPAVAVTPVSGIEEAIALANDTRYGLGAGVFTTGLDNALRFAREVRAGNVMINWSPLWRADLMPYGGLKQSGIGKEGPRYAVAEMTESRTVVFHQAMG